MKRTLWVIGMLALLAGDAARAQTAAAPPPAKPQLEVESVLVEPKEPTATTLCRLKVTIKNSGDKPASMLRFKVQVSGQTLPVYGNQMFMQKLAPGASTEVKLYNFWVSETGRPAPADGKLAVEVALTEAQWMKIGLEDGVETWEPIAPVPDLPAAKSLTLPLKAAAPRP